MHVRSNHQSGIALVLSMIILVMMLMLALPFALSQNLSIGSSDQFSLSQQAQLHRDNVEAFGTGIAADALSSTWRESAIVFHNALVEDISLVTHGELSPTDGAPLYDRNAYPLRLNVDFTYIQTDKWASEDVQNNRAGLIIEDDSGRIDINGLSAGQWVDLLNSAGITYKADELAAGFMNYKYDTLNGNPFTYLSQLLLATPYKYIPPPPTVTPPARPPLSIVELEQLKPHITVHGMSQAKDGMLELGSIFVADPSATPKIGVIDIHPSETLSGPQTLRLYDGERNIDNVGLVPVPVTSPLAQPVNVNSATDVALRFLGFPDLSSFVVSNKRIIFKSPELMTEEMRKRFKPLQDVNKERPALSLTSSAVVVIEANAISNNRQLNPVSQSNRRITALALNSAEPVGNILKHQLGFSQSNNQRHHSLLTTWPRALDRQWENIYADTDFPHPADANYSSTYTVAVKAKPLPGLYGQEILPSDNSNWSKLYRNDVSDLDVVGGPLLVTELTPEGAASSSGSELIYKHQHDIAGNTTSFTLPQMNDTDAKRMSPRHLSWCMTTPRTSEFNSNWVDKYVSILELRAPQSSTGTPISTAANYGHAPWTGPVSGASMEIRLDSGDTNKQHFISLSYDGSTGAEHFILRIAGADIESPDQSYGAPIIPQDNPATSFDERAQGYFGATHTLCPTQQQNWTELHYVYKLQSEHAYDMTLVIQDTSLDGIHFSINGLVGRDLTRLNSYDISEVRPGDHVITPYPLKLETALSEITFSAPLNTFTMETGRSVGPISARGLNLPAPWDTLIPSPRQWLPASTDASFSASQGMLNINGEFIAYNDWSESAHMYTFTQCKRGMRQMIDDVNDLAKSIPLEQVSNPSGAPPFIDIPDTSYYPKMPEHQIGTDVLPGGFSVGINKEFYRGGSVLSQAYVGNPSQNHRIYSHANADILGTDVQLILDDLTEAGFFPLVGFIKIKGTVAQDTEPLDGNNDKIEEIVYYTRAAGSPVLKLDKRNIYDSNSSKALFIHDMTDKIEVSLISWEVSGNPDGRYHTASAGKDHSQANQWGTPNGGNPTDPLQQHVNYDVELLQLYDVTSTGSATYGCIEWIPYTDYITEGGRYYFLNRASGFGGGRGAMGTESPAPSSPRVFPALTRLIPVQRLNHGHLLEAGDRVTLYTNLITSLETRKGGLTSTDNGGTWQAVVRYATSDTGNSFDTWTGTDHYHKDSRFAFTDELPQLNNIQRLSVWPAYAEIDLSSYEMERVASSDFEQNNLPIVNAWAEGYGKNGDDRLVHIGCTDLANLNGEPSHLSSTPVVAKALFDTVVSSKPVSGTSTRDTSILNISSSFVPSGAAGIGTILEVPMNNNGFSFAQKDRSGLIQVNGEVLAYVINNPIGSYAELTIIGRSLLGSSEANSILIGDDVLRLPIGPVAALNTALTNDYIGIVDLINPTGMTQDSQLLSKAHSFLFMKKDGSSFECIQLINVQDKYYTAPWLRGMYNTTVQDWAVDDIIISWNPRYGSALPRTQTHLSSTVQRSAMLRSRCYAWLGMPLRIFGMTLDGSTTKAEVTVQRNPQKLFDFEIRVLDQGFDWDTDTDFIRTTVAPDHKTGLDIPDIFNQEWTPEGGDFEMRTHWRYKSTIKISDPVYQQLLYLSDATHCAPSIESASVKAIAKPRILDAQSK